jgi:hypothetical protein
VEEQGRKAQKTVSLVKEKGIWKMDSEVVQ